VRTYELIGNNLNT